MKKQSLLEQDEWDYLKQHFGLCEHAKTSRLYSVSALDLLDEEICSDYLDRLSLILGSPSKMITASQFLKRYAFLTAAPLLYAMTVYNRDLDFSIENCSLELSLDLPKLEHISLFHVDAVMPDTTIRHVWRDAVIQALFAENIGRLIQVMSKVANVSKLILWENVAVRVFSLYEKRIDETGNQEVLTRAQADFQYLIHHASGALFGEKQNPISRFYNKPTLSSVINSPIRVRKTCCFYYDIASVKEYCSNCPKLRS
ncbi:IucA/IucC family C-terminal-domain containing protein [Sporosarcina sp. E16_8]|uniref:IucA/IucC family C-terminal-domain containing protein n=1 Tax=Sporosarcina sp. E16_8 TaxID=2789295 RepID=UPI001A9179C5|nr:IucA/IucC family C-terminal-domain containing protein [Sporosarcina sp. E16_8]MBO0587153.1 (2Fe-2S)-binding protein [Sporosarcina sp. E16_8]